MRLARYRFDDGDRLARVTDDHARVIDAGTDAPLEALIGTPGLARLAAADGPARPLERARLLMPWRPGQLIGVGLNYRDHAAEQGRALPEMPPVFLKGPASFNRPDGDVPLNPAEPTLDYEAELGVVVGAPLWQATEAQACAAIIGYCVVNDFTYRALAKPDTLTLAKSGPGMAPFGPWLTLAAAVPDALALEIACDVDGEPRQRSSTAQMHVPPAALIARISRHVPLSPGDLIATGSPGGSGVGFTPPRWLAAGDMVEARIAGLGSLRNSVAPAG